MTTAVWVLAVLAGLTQSAWAGDLSWSTFLGGLHDEYITAVTVNASGNVFVTGYGHIDYDDPYFPPSSYNMLAYDWPVMFISKFTSVGTLLWSTFINGGQYLYAHAIAVDSENGVYVAGRAGTCGMYWLTCTTCGAYKQAVDGDTDAFFVKFNKNGHNVLYGTVFGGSADDAAYGVGVDGSGDVWITGYTEGDDMPTTSGAYDSSFDGATDAFVAKLNLGGNGSSDLLYSTHIGGSDLVYSTVIGANGEDQGYALAMDADGDVYVAGSAGLNFPTKSAYQSSLLGDPDAFAAKFSLDADGDDDLIYSTYLGADGADWALGLALLGDQACLTGKTEMADEGFPVTDDAYFGTHQGGTYDAFFSVIGSDGDDLIYATYLGGSEDDQGNGIATSAAEDVYIVGATADATTDFPTTTGAFDTTQNGDTDGFLCCFGEPWTTPPGPTPQVAGDLEELKGQIPKRSRWSHRRSKVVKVSAPGILNPWKSLASCPAPTPPAQQANGWRHEQRGRGIRHVPPLVGQFGPLTRVPDRFLLDHEILRVLPGRVDVEEGIHHGLGLACASVGTVAVEKDIDVTVHKDRVEERLVRRAAGQLGGPGSLDFDGAGIGVRALGSSLKERVPVAQYPEQAVGRHFMCPYPMAADKSCAS